MSFTLTHFAESLDLDHRMMHLVFGCSLFLSLCLSLLLVQIVCHEVYHHHHYPDGKHVIYHESASHPHAPTTCIVPSTMPLKHHPSLISKILSLAKEYLTNSHHVSLFKPTPMEEIHADPSKIPHYFHFHEHLDLSHDEKHHKGHKHKTYHHHHEEHDSDHGHKEESYEHHSNSDDHEDHGHESKSLHHVHSDAKKRIYLNLLNSKIKILTAESKQNVSPDNSSNFLSINNPKEIIIKPISLETTTKPTIVYSKRLEPIHEVRPKIEASVSFKEIRDSVNSNTDAGNRFKFPPPRPYKRGSQSPQSSPVSSSYNTEILPESHEFPFPVTNAEDVVSLMQQKTPVRTSDHLLSPQVYSKNHFDSHESNFINTWLSHKGQVSNVDMDERDQNSSSLLKNHRHGHEIPLLLLKQSQIMSNTNSSNTINSLK